MKTHKTSKNNIFRDNIYVNTNSFYLILFQEKYFYVIKN